MDVFTQGACNRGSKVPVFTTTLSIASACESGLVLHAASSPTSLTKGNNAEQLMLQYDIACCKIKLVLSRLYSRSIAYGSSACGQNEEQTVHLKNWAGGASIKPNEYTYRKGKTAPPLPTAHANCRCALALSPTPECWAHERVGVLA